MRITIRIRRYLRILLHPLQYQRSKGFNEGVDFATDWPNNLSSWLVVHKICESAGLKELYISPDDFQTYLSLLTPSIRVDDEEPEVMHYRGIRIVKRQP